MNEDRATRYHRLRRRLACLSTGIVALFLLGLLASGGSAGLRDYTHTLVGDSFVLATALYTVALLLLLEALQLPIAYYEGVTLERRYGLFNGTVARWWRDHLKAAAVGMTLGVPAAVLVIALVRWGGQYWWLWAALCFAVVLLLLAHLAPVVLLPLLYDIKPLDRKALVDRLMELAERAGTTVLGVFEWRLSDRTTRANAALTGLGRTRRILLSDTLLTDHSDDEIEVILAHELAHHVYRDLWAALAVQAVVIMAAMFAAQVALGLLAAGFGVDGEKDAAMLPLLILSFGCASLLLLPLANGMSRWHERRADRFALEMTRNPEAFLTAMKRLGAQNLAEEHPPRLVVALFHSHPPLTSRLDAARRWMAGHRA